MTTLPIFRLNISIKDDSWEQHFVGRPTCVEVITAITEDRWARLARVPEGNCNLLAKRFDKYLALVTDHGLPKVGEIQLECTRADGTVATVKLTRRLSAIVTSDVVTFE